MSTQNELLMEREALIKGSMDIVTARQALGEGLSDDERARLKSANERIASIDEETQRIAQDASLIAAISGRKSGERVATANQGVVEAAQPARGSGRKSLGDLAVDQLSPRVKAAKNSGERYSLSTDEIQFKAIDQQQVSSWTEGAPYLTDYDWNVQRAKRQRLVVANLVGSGEVSGNAISYSVESPLVEGDFANLAEVEEYPDIQFGDPSMVLDPVRKIGGFTKFSDEFLEDLAFLKTEIDTRLMYLLGLREERQILNGDGTGQNLLGIRKRSGVQTEASASKADNTDAIHRAMTKVELATIYSADGLLIHPLDYEQFRLMKDANEQYIAGGPFQGQYGNGRILEKPPLWGLQTVVTPAIERGKVLVGNYGLAATLYRKGGVRIDVTNSNEADFKHGKVSLRITERAALAVRQPLAFVEVALAA